MERVEKIASIFITAKEELVLEKLKYLKSDLDPVLSENAMSYHYNKLAAGYVNRFNNKEGDKDFNRAGAFLHNILFKQFSKPKGSNKPVGASKTLIESKYKSFENFKEIFLKEAMKIQGSGWIYLARNGDIKTIKNHQIKNDIILLIDWWEHAWVIDYQHDKEKYINNMWKIINWEYINNRIGA